jgi:DNA primase
MYYFQRLLERHDTSNLEGRLAVAEAMVPHLAGIENLVEREEYTKKVAQSLNLEQHLIKTQVQQLRRGQERGSRSQKTGPKAKTVFAPGRASGRNRCFVRSWAACFLVALKTRVTIAESISKDWLSSLPQAVVIKSYADAVRTRWQRFFFVPPPGSAARSGRT